MPDPLTPADLDRMEASGQLLSDFIRSVVGPVSTDTHTLYRHGHEIAGYNKQLIAALREAWERLRQENALFDEMNGQRHRIIIRHMEDKSKLARAEKRLALFEKNRAHCSKCAACCIYADTEDWKNPLCPECWEQAGEPEEEPK